VSEPIAAKPLLHPIALGSIAVLLVNDHYLKLHHPSWLTGKLSDAAGLVFFPLLLATLLRVRVTWAAAATAFVFALVKTVPVATDAYRHALGVCQLAIGGDGSPVDAVTDPTDLLALPVILLAVAVARRCEQLAEDPPGQPPDDVALVAPRRERHARARVRVAVVDRT
jgi:hypothetical protein